MNITTIAIFIANQLVVIRNAFNLLFINLLHINDILSPTWAVDALNKVLIKGEDVRETTTEILALLILTMVYFVIGVWAFRRRHMRARQ